MAEKRYVLANEKLTVTVSNIGAQIKSIKNYHQIGYTRYLKINTLQIIQYSAYLNVISNRKTEL